MTMHHYDRRRRVSRVSAVNKEDAFKFVHSDNWCGRCFYNIPRGTLLLLLPAASMLFIGMSCLIADKVQSWQEGMFQVGIIFVCFGVCLSIGVTSSCCHYWYNNRNIFPWKQNDMDEFVSDSAVDIIVEIEDEAEKQVIASSVGFSTYL